MSRSREWTTKAIAVGLAVVSLGACGLGKVQGYADRVMVAADKTSGIASLGAAIHAELRANPARTTAAALAPLDLPVTASLELGVFPGERRAALRQGSKEVAVFADDRVFVRRPEATSSDARPWLELHLADVRAGSTAFDPASYKAGASYAVLSVLDPRFLLDLASAPLSGSMRDLGPTTIGQQTVQHYRGNFDVDKALDVRRRKNYTDDRREQVRRILGLLSISRTVNPGDVWVDEGGLRRAQLELEVKPSQYAVSRLTITIDVGGEAGAAVVPDRRHTVQVDALSALQRSAAQLGTPLSA